MYAKLDELAGLAMAEAPTEMFQMLQSGEIRLGPAAGRAASEEKERRRRGEGPGSDDEGLRRKAAAEAALRATRAPSSSSKRRLNERGDSAEKRNGESESSDDEEMKQRSDRCGKPREFDDEDFRTEVAIRFQDLSVQHEQDRKWKQAFAQAVASAEADGILELKIVKKGRETGTGGWRNWHLYLEQAEMMVHQDASIDTALTYILNHDLVIKAKCEKSRQRLFERAKQWLAQTRATSNTSEGMVILSKPSLRGASERPAATIYAMMRRTLAPPSGKLAVTTRWPSATRPHWSMQSPDGGCFVSGTLKDGTMNVVAAANFTVGGTPARGADLLLHLQQESSKWIAAYPWAFTFTLGIPANDFGGGGKGDSKGDANRAAPVRQTATGAASGSGLDRGPDRLGDPWTAATTGTTSTSSRAGPEQRRQVGGGGGGQRHPGGAGRGRPLRRS